jgi:hypothetical protein
VAHATEGAVTLLDGPPVHVRRVLRGFGAPRYVAIAPAGHHAFVTDSAHGELVVDLRRGRVVHRLEVDAGARHLTLDPLGRRLWIALGSTAPSLVVVDVGDPVRPRVVRRIRPPFGSGELTVLDGAGGVRWSLAFAGAAHDACVM